MKKKLFAWLSFLVLASAVFAAAMPESVRAQHANKIIHAQMSIGDGFDYASAVKKDKTIFITSPFGDALSAQGLVLSESSLFSYEFYAPVPLGGMGGVELQVAVSSITGSVAYINMSALFHEYKTADQSGAPVMFAADITEQLSNGWYKRSFAFPARLFKDAAEVRIQHIFLASAIANSDITALRAQGRTAVDAYYKNFKLSEGEDTRNIYDEANGGAPFSNWESFNFDDSSITVNSTNSEYLPSQTTGFENSTYYYVTGKKLALALVGDPSPVTIETDKTERVFYVGQEYDLSDCSFTSGVQLDSVTKEGREQAVSGNRFTPQTTGKYIAVLKKSENGLYASVKYGFTVYEFDRPVILNSDLESLPRQCSAGQRYVLPAVKAVLRGEKTLETRVEVWAEGEAVQLSDESGFKGFTPEAKKTRDYEVKYIAESGAYSFSRTVTVTAVDYDYPVADFSAWPSNIEIGSVFALPPLKVTDPSDGEIGDGARIQIMNTYGEQIEISELNAERTIRPVISGIYTAKVTAADSDGNERHYEYKFNVNSIREAVYTVRAYIAPEKRAAGVKKQFTCTLSRSVLQTTEILEGDRLFFDVYSRTPMAGLGSFSGQFTGSFHSREWPYMHDFYGSSKIKDQNGLSMELGADISSRLKDRAGNSVWYSREVVLGGELFSGRLAHYSLAFSTTAACGEYIEVSYRNIYILRKNGLKIPILPTATPPDVGIWDKQNIREAFVVGELDPTPVLLEQFLPVSGELGREVLISDKVIFDFLNNRLIDARLKITDSSGNEMPTEKNSFGYGFTTMTAGTYTLEFSYIENGLTKTVSRPLVMADLELPEVEFKGFTQRLKVGDTLVLPAAECTDYGSPEGTVTVDVKAFYKSRDISDQIKDGRIENVSEGQYMLIYTVTDASGNEVVERLYVDVTAADKKSGCGAFTAGSTLSGMCAATLAAALIGITVLRRKKVNEK